VIQKKKIPNGNWKSTFMFSATACKNSDSKEKNPKWELKANRPLVSPRPASRLIQKKKIPNGNWKCMVTQAFLLRRPDKIQKKKIPNGNWKRGALAPRAWAYPREAWFKRKKSQMGIESP